MPYLEKCSRVICILLLVVHVNLENGKIPCNLNKITIYYLDLKKFKYFFKDYPFKIHWELNSTSVSQGLNRSNLYILE